MTDEKSLVNLGDISKPAAILVEKVSDAVGGIFKPYQIVRVARAEAEAEVIRAQAQIKIEDLHRRAMHRFLQEEARKQANIEEITRNALPSVADGATPDQLDDDWIVNFFDKCRIISDQQMQSLWSLALAGEANTPGSFSRRTIDLLASLDKRDAQLFTKLCSHCWIFGSVTALVFDHHEPFYEERGITFNSLQHLESIGLIQFGAISGFKRIKLPKQFVIFYYGRGLELQCRQEADNAVDIGQVMLTQSGAELAPITGSAPDPEVYDFVKQRFAGRGLVAPPAPEVSEAPGKTATGVTDGEKAG